MKVSGVFSLMSILAFGFLTACASSGKNLLAERQDQNKARYSAYAADGFIIDGRMPDQRPNRNWEFYYKNCSLVSRNPYPNRDEYSCTDPF